MPAASKAKAASWVRPVACSFLPVCMGAGWWEKGFSGSGTSCNSDAKSDRLPAWAARAVPVTKCKAALFCRATEHAHFAACQLCLCKWGVLEIVQVHCVQVHCVQVQCDSARTETLLYVKVCLTAWVVQQIGGCCQCSQ